MKLIFKLLLLIVLLLSCNDKNNDEEILYVGAYRIMDLIIPPSLGQEFS